ncbi:hypothetical protein EVAR_100176_1 [Eumeta japonica]|uniref:Uncharacterized protein n=1 Tax=Eumeta variegata TaxID=151549 RepID=A0A4C2A4Q0_EUMVA|nr:hypothetical protein EVAR_100176_1 [Eumeta japonica]
MSATWLRAVSRQSSINTVEHDHLRSVVACAHGRSPPSLTHSDKSLAPHGAGAADDRRICVTLLRNTTTCNIVARMFNVYIDKLTTRSDLKLPALKLCNAGGRMRVAAHKVLDQRVFSPSARTSGAPKKVDHHLRQCIRYYNNLETIPIVIVYVHDRVILVPSACYISDISNKAGTVLLRNRNDDFVIECAGRSGAAYFESCQLRISHGYLKDADFTYRGRSAWEYRQGMITDALSLGGTLIIMLPFGLLCSVHQAERIGQFVAFR